MNRPAAVLLATTLLLAAGCAAPPAPLVPAPSGETRAAAAGWLDGRDWTAQHEDCVALARAEPLDVVFLGDSITQSWGGPGRRVGAPAAEVWERWYGARRAAAFGISGDRTQHVLWRLEHGLLEALHPRVVVLLIGTNNVPHDAPADVADGIAAIVDALRAHPSAPRVVIVLPFRGVEPGSADRAAVRAIAAPLRGLAAREGVHVVDLGARLEQPDGRYDPELVGADGVHLRPAGYEVWARAVEPFVALALAIPAASEADAR